MQDVQQPQHAVRALDQRDCPPQRVRGGRSAVPGHPDRVQGGGRAHPGRHDGHDAGRLLHQLVRTRWRDDEQLGVQIRQEIAKRRGVPVHLARMGAVDEHAREGHGLPVDVGDGGDETHRSQAMSSGPKRHRGIGAASIRSFPAARSGAEPP